MATHAPQAIRDGDGKGKWLWNIQPLANSAVMFYLINYPCSEHKNREHYFTWVFVHCVCVSPGQTHLLHSSIAAVWFWFNPILIVLCICLRFCLSSYFSQIGLGASDILVNSSTQMRKTETGLRIKGSGRGRTKTGSPPLYQQCGLVILLADMGELVEKYKNR